MLLLGHSVQLVIRKAGKMSTKANWPEKMTAIRLRQHKDIYEYRIMGAVTTDASVYSTDKDVLEYRAKQVRALPKMVELLKEIAEQTLWAENENGEYEGTQYHFDAQSILREIGEMDA